MRLPTYWSRMIQLIVFRLVVLLDLIIDMFDFLAVHLIDAVINIQVWISHISVLVLEVVVQSVRSFAIVLIVSAIT